VPPSLPGILAEIVASKEGEVEGLRGRRSELEEAASAAPPARSLAAALRRPGEVALVAECKRRSPGAGEIRPGLDPAALVRSYRDRGAAALSVLTDGPFFGGGPEDVRAVRETVDLPILRKDFTLHPLQVLEARAMGADAVLLIVRILPDERLRELLALAAELGMDALVETHDADEVRRALDAGAGIVGINNRDLATFETDLATTLDLLDEVGNDVAVISESGIRTREDVARLGAAGVHAVLVGETLLRAEDPGAAAARLSGVPRRARVRTGP
jgi:indole-3-glycerol phosphate synthase